VVEAVNDARTAAGRIEKSDTIQIDEDVRKQRARLEERVRRKK
jgi:hypothetical protein